MNTQIKNIPLELYEQSDLEYDVNIIIGENGSGKSTFLNTLSKEIVKSRRQVIAIATSVHDKFTIKNKLFNFYGGRQGRNMISKIIKKSIINSNYDYTDKFNQTDKITNLIRVLDYVGYSSRFGIRINGYNPDNLNYLEIDSIIDEEYKYDLLSLLNKYNDILIKNQIVSLDLHAVTSGNINSSALGGLLKYESIMKKLKILSNINIYLEKDDKQIELKNASSGELMMISTLVFISSIIDKNSIIIIDEPENSLHPKWQKEYIEKILDLFYLYRPKIILATHSSLIIPLKNQYAKLFTIENNLLNLLMRNTSNNEEILSSVFKVITPENRYLSDNIIDLINKFDNDKINYEDILQIIDTYHGRVYDQKQKVFLTNVKDLIDNIKVSKSKSSAL